MRRRRTLVLGGIAGAVAGLLMAPRRGRSWRGGGSLAAFAGTPCASPARPPAETPAAETTAAQATARDAPAADDDGGQPAGG